MLRENTGMSRKIEIFLYRGITHKKNHERETAGKCLMRKWRENFQMRKWRENIQMRKWREN
jgi:hypothetical protein